MKEFRSFLFVALAGLVCAACATNNVESRRKERQTAYASLSQEARQDVDAGRVKVGMTEDAVYIALGKPSQIVNNETAQGVTSTWYYYDSELQGDYYWSFHGPFFYPGPPHPGPWHGRPPGWGPRHFGPPHPGPVLPLVPQWGFRYYTTRYVRAEITLENGKVTRVSTQPKP